MPVRLAVPFLLAALTVLVAGCGTAPTPAPAAEPGACTLVLLRTGPRREPLSEAESKQVFGGHMGNMERLARERHLLVAGPYGKEKSDPLLRGLFVFATADRERARELAETDPGFQAGVFAFDYHTLVTAAPLRACLEAELLAMDEAARQQRARKPGEGLRGYVLATIEDGAAARAALAELPGVLWFAELDGTRAFVLLDATTRAAARTMLEPAAERLGAVRLDEWFATSRLADLPSMQRGD